MGKNGSKRNINRKAQPSSTLVNNAGSSQTVHSNANNLRFRR